ncbi:amidohydrolase family protein [uncultured Umboniibacter sp.]|uniref:amidohydrolase family protein n=1 Tax=uncultured Umboniibacter sp. TaxID=1798917 RepID=UPI0026106009|nr:amidohydrolase family protein [uncultured Umboniibacter sp.]
MTPDRIIDSHHHLWDLAKVHYPWLIQRGVTRFFGDPTAIQRDYLSADFQSDHGKLNVVDSVHIQVGAENGLNEAQWIDVQANDNRLPSAQVSFCDLAADDTEAQIHQLASLNSLRGIRQIVGRSPAEDAQTGTDGLISSKAFSKGLGLLEQQQLSFDLQLIPEQMLRMATLLEAHPSLSVSLCHMGSPWYQSGAGFETWKAGITELAKNPNIHCKLSGLVMFNHSWSPADFMPFIEHVLNNFGDRRIMFGSNFPVDGLHANYEQLVQAYLQCCNQIGNVNLDAIFHDNAAAFYRLAR